MDEEDLNEVEKSGLHEVNSFIYVYRILLNGMYVYIVKFDDGIYLFGFD